MSPLNKLRGAQVMSREDFWDMIEQARKACGEDQAKYMNRIKRQLTELGPQHAQDFHDILHAYSELADKYGLWSAASMMGNSSDDGFFDFRVWLISQGQEVYRAALKDPDTLVDIDPGDGYWFEEMAYAGDTVLQNLTGKTAYKETDPLAYETLLDELEADIQYGKGINYPYANDELPDYFPRLYELYPDKGPCWNLTSPKIQEAREADLPPKPEQGNNLEMGGM